MGAGRRPVGMAARRFRCSSYGGIPLAMVFAGSTRLTASEPALGCPEG